MIVSPDLLRALAHALLDVTIVSGVLALAVLAVERVPGVDASTRSRCWSAVAIVPLLAFAAVRSLLRTEKAAVQASPGLDLPTMGDTTSRVAPDHLARPHGRAS